MLDHVSIRVSDFEKSKKFYTSLLAVLGYQMHVMGDGKAGFRAPDGSSVWVRKDDSVTKGIHFAFRAHAKETVDRFYSAGLSAGGTDNGKPGTRSYRGEQYIAFVLDPDGNNIEIVCDPSTK